MIPVLDGVPGVPGVALVLRLERLKIRGGSGVAQLRGVDAGGDRFPSSAGSEPVASSTSLSMSSVRSGSDDSPGDSHRHSHRHRHHQSS